MFFLTYRAACDAAHEFCFRVADDVVVINRDPSGLQPMPDGRWLVEPRYVGARPRGLGDVIDHQALVVAIVRPRREGSAGGVESIIGNTEPVCGWCNGTGFDESTLGGRRPCRRCSGTGRRL